MGLSGETSRRGVRRPVHARVRTIYSWRHEAMNAWTRLSRGSSETAIGRIPRPGPHKLGDTCHRRALVHSRSNRYERPWFVKLTVGLISALVVAGMTQAVPASLQSSPASRPSQPAHTVGQVALTSTSPGPAWAFASLGNMFAPNISIEPYAVTCVSSSDCWAVGDTVSSGPTTTAGPL